MEGGGEEVVPEPSWFGTCFENMFHFCMARSFYKNMELMLGDLYGIKMAHRDKKGRTPLHYMCLDGRILVLKLMLVDHDIETNLNAVDDMDRTPLHFACRNGHEECAVALLKLGADITLKDVHGWTALDAARFNGRKELLDALRGNIRPGLMSPVNASAGPMSPSKKINASELKFDLPPEETAYGKQLDDVFIPSPALQRLRKAGNKIKDMKKRNSFKDIVTAAASQSKESSRPPVGALSFNFDATEEPVV